jgi:hypothetical protein
MKRRFCFVIDILRWIGGCAGLLFDRRVKKKAGWLGTSQWALGSNSGDFDLALIILSPRSGHGSDKKGPSVDKAWHVEKLITQ